MQVSNFYDISLTLISYDIDSDVPTLGELRIKWYLNMLYDWPIDFEIVR